MARELEAKIKLSLNEADALHETVCKIGKFQGARFEINQFFDTKEQKLSKAGNVVRLRTIKWQDKRPNEFIITFKGKQGSGKIKNREEIEYSVSCSSAAEKVFKALGYQKSFSFEKYRMSYRVNKCLVEFDEIPYVGHFCEIEGPTKKAIVRVITRIGCGDAKLISKGYPTLIREHFKSKKSKLKTLRFT